MESQSPVYELLQKFEEVGLKIPRNWDLIPKSELIKLLQEVKEK